MLAPNMRRSYEDPVAVLPPFFADLTNDLLKIA